MDTQLANKLNELIDKILFNKLDEEDTNTQEYYFKLFNKLIDCILLLEYDETDAYKTFVSVKQINDKIIKVFSKINKENKDYEMLNLIRKIIGATGENNKYKEYKIIIHALYEKYLEKGYLEQEETIDFYNGILNKQQNAYLSKKRKELISNKMNKFTLTNKKINNLINTAKLKHANKLIKYGNFELLGTTEEEMYQKLEDLHLHLNSIKPFNKEPLSEIELKKLDVLFLNGILTEEVLYNYPLPKRKIITNKYSQILIPLLSKIDDCDVEVDVSKVEFNYNHIKIFDKRKYIDNRDVIMSKLPVPVVEKIINNIDSYKEILKLLPLVKILNNFSFELYYQILIDYDKIIKRLRKEHKLPENPTVEELMHNMSDIIKLANIYKDLDEYVVSILGVDIIKKIMKKTPISNNPNDYVEYYIKMLNTKTSDIPQISGEWKNYIFENDKPYDKERLLIGKNSYKSCIGPKGVGEEAFHFALTSSFSDVLMIKDKETNQFVGRTIMYRLGNSIIFAPIKGENEENEEFYNEEFFKLLGDKIIEASTIKGDNIDYVLLTKLGKVKFQNIKEEDTETFLRSLPHSDLTNQSYIIGQSKRRTFVNPSLKKQKTYHKKRQEIKNIDTNITEELLHIKGIQIYTAHSDTRKNILKEEYQKIKETKYKNAYIGQDWYIAITEDNKIENVIINHNKEVDNEIKCVLDDILEKANIQTEEIPKLLTYSK